MTFFDSSIQPLLSPSEFHRIMKRYLLAGYTAEKEFHLSLNHNTIIV